MVLLSACTTTPVGEGDGVMSSDEIPEVGWIAEFTTHFHDTAGTAEILDESTIEIRDFVFDGQGINAKLFLANDGAAFTEDYPLSDNLVGTPSDGDTLTLTIPDQAEFENWNLITLWCIPAGASFGDGVFLPPQ